MGLFLSKDTTIKLKASSSVTITGTSATLGSYFLSGATTVITAKTVEIMEGEQPFDAQFYTGTSGRGFQNQGKVRKPKGKASLKMTLDYNALKAIQTLLMDTATTVASTYTRLSSGDGTRKEVSALVELDDGTDLVTFVFDKAEQVAPETKLTGVDGQYEYSVTLECLAKDFYGPEFENN